MKVEMNLPEIPNSSNELIDFVLKIFWWVVTTLSGVVTTLATLLYKTERDRNATEIAETKAEHSKAIEELKKRVEATEAETKICQQERLTLVGECAGLKERCKLLEQRLTEITK